MAKKLSVDQEAAKRALTEATEILTKGAVTELREVEEEITKLNEENKDFLKRRSELFGKKNELEKSIAEQEIIAEAVLNTNTVKKSASSGSSCVV